jgi:adenylate cyclase
MRLRRIGSTPDECGHAAQAFGEAFQRMKQVFNGIVGAGVRAGMSVREARFIKAGNIVALITVVWLILLFPTVVPYLPAVRNVLIVSVMCAIGLCFVPVLNSFGFYRTAQIYAPAISMCTIAFNALHLGHEAWNDLLLLAVILVSFYYVESLSTLLCLTLFGLALFAGVEGWYASGRQGLLDGVAPAQFFATIKNTSVYSVVVLTIGFAYYNRTVLNSTQRALDRESARSESLLLNILPKTIADRLKSSPQLIADRIPEVSIVFADLVGFTEMSQKMDAGSVVGMLNEIFLGFDRAARRLGLEKIKTMGDAYMVVAGVPEPRADHAEAAVAMALAMQAHVETLSARRPELRLRIGIHTGPVVAGVIGENKFSYDLWGDSVNIASRMESHGLAGRIHVSDIFARAAGGAWRFEPRERINVKGQGPMQTYFLSQPARAPLTPGM